MMMMMSVASLAASKSSSPTSQ